MKKIKSMSQKPPTLTLAVCAYNEEKNIGAFIRSVIGQTHSNFELRKILVISDGSTDKTVKIVKSFKQSNISVINYKKRVGKSSRLNHIYKTLNTDILVQSDADVVFEHPHVLEHLVKSIEKNTSIGMCGGNPMPMPATTFTEKAVNYTVEAYRTFREKVRNGNNVFSADGRLLCFRDSFIKDVRIPVDMIANDMFCYFMCLNKGYRYRYVGSAVVRFRSPQTLKDQIRQNVRFRASPLRMMRYFPHSLVQKEIQIPKTVLIPTFFTQIVKNPILCLYIWSVNAYCRWIAKKKERSLGGMWDIAFSTKAVNTSKAN